MNCVSPTSAKTQESLQEKTERPHPTGQRATLEISEKSYRSPKVREKTQETRIKITQITQITQRDTHTRSA